MAKRMVVLVNLLIIGIVLAKIFGTNEIGIPLLPIYGFASGIGLAFSGVLLLPFRLLRPVSIYAIIGAVALIWLSEAVLVAALLF